MAFWPPSGWALGVAMFGLQYPVTTIFTTSLIPSPQRTVCRNGNGRIGTQLTPKGGRQVRLEPNLAGRKSFPPTMVVRWRLHCDGASIATATKRGDSMSYFVGVCSSSWNWDSVFICGARDDLNSTHTYHHHHRHFRHTWEFITF